MATYDFTKFKKGIAGAEEWLKKEFSGIRTGQASPAVLDGVKVESYGTVVPISQVAAVTTEGPRTIRIIPWDAGQVKDIEKAITIANLGLSVGVDDKGIRVNFPELTSERRTAILKIAKEKVEEGKKQVRSHRDDVMKELQTKEKDGSFGKDDVFRFKNEAQKIVDQANKNLDASFERKEKEILS
ncbi:MAG: Frr, ribosome recycling factor [Candidatus Taylorbacteria bacterium]|nr:Frr, ribosome recycling factor [Candidatus Taylorbacteria bacterium]